MQRFRCAQERFGFLMGGEGRFLILGDIYYGKRKARSKTAGHTSG